MLMTGPSLSEMEAPTDFLMKFPAFIPESVKRVHGNVKDESFFLQNGALVYRDNAMFERATPECLSPYETSVYLQSSENLMVDMLGRYVMSSATSGTPMQARMQRRVVDSFGNTCGSHDNFELRNEAWVQELENNVAFKGLLLKHLASRSFMTGAGYVYSGASKKPGRICFAQKVQSITDIDDYGYSNTACRIVPDDEVGYRMEIRCNDINISPWATQVRLGGMALVLMLAQTPLANEAAGKLYQKDATYLQMFREFNRAKVDPDGQLHASTGVLESVDTQERIIDVMENGLRKYVDIPADYDLLLSEMQEYCDDFRRVLHGQDDLKILTDRSDFAVKLDAIRSSIADDKRFGIPRHPHDVLSRFKDLKYDHIAVSTDESGKSVVRKGYGYKHRDKGGFRLPHKAADVERSYSLPPTGTRAAIRGEMIRQDMLNRSWWSKPFIEGSTSVAADTDYGPVVLQDTSLTAERLHHVINNTACK